MMIPQHNNNWHQIVLFLRLYYKGVLIVWRICFVFVCSDTLSFFSELFCGPTNLSQNSHVQCHEWMNYPGTPAKHAFPVCVWLFLHLHAVGQLSVVMGADQFSLGEIRQRWPCVWNVATQQDAERHRIKILCMSACFNACPSPCQAVNYWTNAKRCQHFYYIPCYYAVKEDCINYQVAATLWNIGSLALSFA